MYRLSSLELQRLLHIPNPRKDSIYSVVGRMDVLLTIFEKEKRFHSLLPFLKTYYLVTKAAAQNYIRKRHYFTNIRDYETLDVYFASLYFKPLSEYLTEGEYDTPWKTYFDYCHKENGIPFLQMLLGINAHINANLSTALIDLHYTHERDFFLVNDILQEVIPDVMHFMIFSEHDIFSAGSLVMKQFFLSQFHEVVEKWRSEAWMNAKFSKSRYKKSYEHIAQKTEHIGQQLIQDFNNWLLLPELPSILDAIKGPAILSRQHASKE